MQTTGLGLARSSQEGQRIAAPFCFSALRGRTRNRPHHDDARPHLRRRHAHPGALAEHARRGAAVCKACRSRLAARGRRPCEALVERFADRRSGFRKLRGRCSGVGLLQPRPAQAPAARRPASPNQRVRQGAFPLPGSTFLTTRVWVKEQRSPRGDPPGHGAPGQANATPGAVRLQAPRGAPAAAQTMNEADVPVAQLDESAGLPIRRPRVRSPPGTWAKNARETKCTCSSDGQSAGPPVRRPRVRIPPGACSNSMERCARSSTGSEHRITNPEAGGSNPSGRTEKISR